MRPPIESALRYAELGWKIHPCRETPGAGFEVKAPYLGRGYKPSSDPQTVKAWWTRWPHALIGLPVPPTSVVLDIDPRDGGTVEALEEAAGGPLPETMIARSGGDDGGLHYWFRTELVGLRHRQLGPGIDIREGGRHYVIAPPSIHPDSGKPYRWLSLAPVALIPPGIAHRIAPKPVPSPLPASPLTSHSHRAIDGLLRRMGEAIEGERNSVLFWCSARMAERETQRASTDWRTLANIALQRGLSESEVARTIESARRTAGVAA